MFESVLDNVLNFIATHPWVTLPVAAIGLAGMYFVKRRNDAFSAAVELVEKQHDPLPQDLVEGLIEHAEHEGNKKEVLTLLRIIRTKYGHAGVRYGHIAWIWNVIASGKVPEDVEHVPSFEKVAD